MSHVLDRLQRYVDDELAAADRRAVAEHCAECAGCARTLAELQGLWTEVAALREPVPGAPLWPLLQARVAAERRGGGVEPAGRPWQRPAWGLAGAALAAGLALGLVLGDAGADKHAGWSAGAPEAGAVESLLLDDGATTLGGLWLAAGWTEEAGS